MGGLCEALPRLTAARLVDGEPSWASACAHCPGRTSRELTEARSELETLVLRRSIEHGGLEWASEVLALHHRLERTAQTEDDDPARLGDEWVTAHAA